MSQAAPADATLGSSEVSSGIVPQFCSPAASCGVQVQLPEGMSGDPSVADHLIRSGGAPVPLHYLPSLPPLAPASFRGHLRRPRDRSEVSDRPDLPSLPWGTKKRGKATCVPTWSLHFGFRFSSSSSFEFVSEQKAPKRFKGNSDMPPIVSLGSSASGSDQQKPPIVKGIPEISPLVSQPLSSASSLCPPSSVLSSAPWSCRVGSLTVFDQGRDFVLEVFAGSGMLTSKMRSSGFDAYGIDLSNSMFAPFRRPCFDPTSLPRQVRKRPGNSSHIHVSFLFSSRPPAAPLRGHVVSLWPSRGPNLCVVTSTPKGSQVWRTTLLAISLAFKPRTICTSSRPSLFLTCLPLVWHGASKTPIVPLCGPCPSSALCSVRLVSPTSASPCACTGGKEIS